MPSYNCRCPLAPLTMVIKFMLTVILMVFLTVFLSSDTFSPSRPFSRPAPVPLALDTAPSYTVSDSSFFVHSASGWAVGRQSIKLSGLVVFLACPPGHTENGTLHTTHGTAHCTLHTLNCTMHTVHCTLYTAH